MSELMMGHFRPVVHDQSKPIDAIHDATATLGVLADMLLQSTSDAEVLSCVVPSDFGSLLSNLRNQLQEAVDVLEAAALIETETRRSPSVNRD